MAKINEATDTDLKIIEELYKLGWKRGDTLLYQKEYNLTSDWNFFLHALKSKTIPTPKERIKMDLNHEKRTYSKKRKYQLFLSKRGRFYFAY